RQIGQPIGLLHAAGSELIVQLVDARHVSPDGHVSSELTSDLREPESLSTTSQTAGQAVATVLSRASRVLMVLSTPEDEADVLADPRVSIVTLLTGADDASCVSAYRTIRRLAGAIDAARSDQHEPVVLSLATCGGAMPKAEAALARLRESATNFLDVQLQHAAHLERLEAGPGTSSVLFDGAIDVRLSELLSAGAAMPRVMPSVSTRHGVNIAPPTSTTAQAATPAAAPAGTPLRLKRFADDNHALSVQPPVAAATIEAKPAPITPPPVPMPTASVSNPAPARGIDAPRQTALGPVLAGLSALPFHCPQDPDLLLATDAAGVPQVVARAIGVEPRQMVYRLVAAAAWMWANRSLLSQVSGGSMRDDTRPQLHLITDDIAAVRALLDSEIKVHAAIDVTRARQGVVMLAMN
ncbi:MAG: hypothetical protein MUE97_07495, partial [Phycisphaerales bacterium]|nr:hypothetical protein [Phycisphaerales bacterium]